MLEVVYVVGLGLPATGVTSASMSTLGTLAWHDMNGFANAHKCTLLNV